MFRLNLAIVVCVVTISFVIILKYSEACNQTICASMVSRCLLVGSCKCDIGTSSCNRNCSICLSYLYHECCSCIGMCPTPNITLEPLSKISHVADLDQPIPLLFESLTKETDPESRWISITFPVDYSVPLKVVHYTSKVEEEVKPTLDVNLIAVNCTVAYITDCLSWNQCKLSCQSMGATSYRWFHDGCCECIGETCINYGVNESRCRKCHIYALANDEEYDDYGQDLTNEELLNEQIVYHVHNI